MHLDKNININLETYSELNEETKKILHSFFRKNEKYDKLATFEKSNLYSFTNKKVNYHIKFSRDLLCTFATDTNTYYYHFSNAKKLGSGAYGTVFMGQSLVHDHDMMVLDKDVKAIKKQELKGIDKEDIEREYNFITKIPYMKGFGMVDSLEHGKCYNYMVMNKIDGNELSKEIFPQCSGIHSIYLRLADPNFKKIIANHYIGKIMINALTSLNIISNEGIIHNDIKYENLLINPINDMITIIDFGLSFTKADKAIFYGSPLFCAPEKFVQEYDHELDQKVDVYSLGIIFRLLSCDINLINKLKKLLTLNDVTKDRANDYLLKTTLPVEFDPEVKRNLRSSGIDTDAFAKLLEKMCCPHPEDRISAQDALEECMTIFVKKKEIEMMYLIAKRQRYGYGFFTERLPKRAVENILNHAGLLSSCYQTPMYDVYEKQNSNLHAHRS